MSYSQLTYEQRYLIYQLLKIGYTQTQIAEIVSVHKSTIGRELKRNTGQRGYRYKQAQRMAEKRKNKAGKRITANDWLIIERYLRKDFSPEQTAQWVLQGYGIQVSPEWIYHHIWADKRNGGQLYHHLRRKKKYRKRGANGDKRGKIPRQRSIEERPAIVDGRERIGDWEADTIIGKGMKGAIVTLVDRKSRFLRMGLVEQRTKEAVKESMIDLLKGYPVHTITCDNGKEFAAHLIRQYISKDADFRKLTDIDISFVEYRLNTRPRKCLSFSPPMVFLKNHCCT